MKDKTLSEADIKRQIRDVLTACGIFHWPGGVLFGKNGTSDILGVMPPDGRSIAIEVKRQGWRPPGRESKAYRHYWEQRDFIENVNRKGGIGFFATSVDEVIDRLGLQAKLTPLFRVDKGAA